MKYSIAKGVFDILPKDPTKDGAFRASHLWYYLEDSIHRLARDYGFREIRTPVFERTELFVRGVGESSDIITKPSSIPWITGAESPSAEPGLKKVAPAQ